MTSDPQLIISSNQYRRRAWSPAGGLPTGPAGEGENRGAGAAWSTPLACTRVDRARRLLVLRGLCPGAHRPNAGVGAREDRGPLVTGPARKPLREQLVHFWKRWLGTSPAARSRPRQTQPFFTFSTCLRKPSVADSIAPFIARLSTKPGNGTDRSTVMSNRTFVLSPSRVKV